MEIHCLKCKRKNEANDIKLVSMPKTGRPALKGTCAVCDNTVQTFISAAAAAEYEAVGTP